MRAMLGFNGLFYHVRNMFKYHNCQCLVTIGNKHNKLLMDKLVWFSEKYLLYILC